jgi:transposase
MLMKTAQTITYPELLEENLFLKQQTVSLQEKLTVLEERLNWFQRQVFGQRSEKTTPNADVLCFDFYKAETQSDQPKIDPPAPKPRKKEERSGKDKISFPDDLPKVSIILDLPDDEKICKETGKPLIKIGEEITSKLAHKPGSYYIKEYIRLKYAMPKGSEEGIIIAELPDSFLPKCRIDESLLADLLVKKFADHLPLYRITEGLLRDNINISRQVLSNWVINSGKALTPIYKAMKKAILESENIFVDETPLSLQVKGKGKVHQAFMWVIAGGESSNPPYRVYSFKLNRKHENVTELLGDYQGVLHSDKYGAYENLASQKKIKWCPCWAHIRRKFFESETSDPFKTWVLEKINDLFALDATAWTMSCEERLKFREEKEIPIIDELIYSIKDKLLNGKIVHRSKFRIALGYFIGLIPYLKNYTLFPFARLDNNVAERAIRPLTIGRKNWLFVGSIEGGEAAGVLYSLIQTCRALEINPREYLEDVLRRIMNHNSQNLHELLPDNWAKAKNSASI